MQTAIGIVLVAMAAPALQLESAPIVALMDHVITVPVTETTTSLAVMENLASIVIQPAEMVRLAGLGTVFCHLSRSLGLGVLQSFSFCVGESVTKVITALMYNFPIPSMIDDWDLRLRDCVYQRLPMKK